MSGSSASAACANDAPDPPPDVDLPQGYKPKRCSLCHSWSTSPSPFVSDGVPHWLTVEWQGMCPWADGNVMQPTGLLCYACDYVRRSVPLRDQALEDAFLVCALSYFPRRTWLHTFVVSGIQVWTMGCTIREASCLQAGGHQEPNTASSFQSRVPSAKPSFTRLLQRPRRDLFVLRRMM
jgi:hypothetical protein